MIRVPENLRFQFDKAKNTLLEAEKICIISHKGPDGDAVGSNLGLRLCLENMGKQVTSACVHPIPPNSMFLKNADTYVQDFNYEDFDVIVSTDCAALKMVKFHKTKPELLSGKKPFINIDHHGSNDGFGTINMVEPDMCAASYIVYLFLSYSGWKIDRHTATCLLHGIYFDTGSLMHSNTTADVYLVAGQLTSLGADIKSIVKHLFHTTPINKMRLWGRILERAYINEENVTVSAVNQSDYKICDATSKDTGGAIDYLNSVPDSKYCVLLSEDDRGIVKGSLRTQRDDVNLSDVASKWGGGGHPRASGFGIEGKLKPVTKWQILNEGDDSGEKIEF
ncbi:hypothetical protein GF354_03845 [Candidatus Peregrinibacteria bacterium]|nr:hypothetical protein [Candidatus Peregrinibacteria bacterium]